MLDQDLAELYGTKTKRLNEQVKRNQSRFPDDFMFQLSKEEFANLKSQFATSSWGGRRSLPFAFTEHGVLMLSSVLNSESAIEVNIQVVRIFTKMREMLISYKDVMLQIQSLENQLADHDNKIQLIFEYLKQMEESKRQETEFRERKQIGFKPSDNKVDFF